MHSHTVGFTSRVSTDWPRGRGASTTNQAVAVGQSGEWLLSPAAPLARSPRRCTLGTSPLASGRMGKKSARSSGGSTSSAAAALPPRLSFKSSLLSGMAVMCLVGGCCVAQYKLRWPTEAAPAAEAARLQLPKRCGRAQASRVAGCSPSGRSCGHVVVDDFATSEEVTALRAIASRGMALGGGGGGPTILDLQSGALSYGEQFIDVWVAFNASGQQAFRRREVAVYAEIVERVRALAETTFRVGGAAARSDARLHLTAPTFFSRISGDREPRTAHDEYWHVHVDAEQYGSFVFTALLYLADAGHDFDGGHFHFLPPESAHDGEVSPDSTPVATVDPRRGRLVLFTSGSEHPHRVSRVTAGTRLALTIAFTCDESAAITDFLGRALDD